MQAQKERYPLIDSIRGLAIVNMVIFHFLYDIFIVYGQNPKWYGLYPIHIWQQAICWTFFFISGFVWKWGEKGNLHRGLLFNLYGALISLVTWVVIPSEAIWFGILSFMGCAVLLLIPLQKYLQKVPTACGMGLSLLLFAIFKNVQNGFLGIGGIELIRLPQWLYSIKILTPFGFPFPGFVSNDYFPILPWIFIYLFGYFFCRFFVRSSWLQKFCRCKVPFLTVIGQKSIWIYLLHQPLSMLICILIFR